MSGLGARATSSRSQQNQQKAQRLHRGIRGNRTVGTRQRVRNNSLKVDQAPPRRPEPGNLQAAKQEDTGGLARPARHGGREGGLQLGQQNWVPCRGPGAK